MNGFRYGIVFIFFLAIMFFSCGVSAKNIYVDSVNGSDDTSYANNNVNQPFRSIGRALWGSADFHNPNSSQAAVAGDIVYIREGTYNTQYGSNTRYYPIYNPVNSGNSSAPIIIQAEGTVTLQVSGAQGGPVLGSYNRSYIEWRGHFFINEEDVQTRPDTGPVVVWSSEHITIDGLEVDGMTAPQIDNHNAIRIEYARDVLIKNTRLYNNFEGSTPANRNGAAIMAYDSERVIIENNEIFDSATGIFIKGNNPNQLPDLQAVTIRYNYIHDVLNDAIAIGGVNAISESFGARIYQNALTNAAHCVTFIGYDGTSPADVAVFNNVMHNCSNGAIFLKPNIAGYSNLDFNNNIIQNSAIAFQGEDVTNSVMQVMDVINNVYHNVDVYARFLYTNYSMAELNALGLGNENQIQYFDPQLDETAHLPANSPLLTITQDFSDYDSDGDVEETIPVGAYITGNEILSVITPDRQRFPLFRDDFEYIVARDYSDSASEVFTQQGGWSYAKAINITGSHNGYLYTVDHIPGYDGQFPGHNSNRVLAIEARASQGQSDFYLQYGMPESDNENIPGDVWFQFWIYPNHYDDPSDMNDQMSQFSRFKFIYPCRTFYPCTYDHINWLFNMGYRTAEPFWGNPEQDTTQLFMTTTDPYNTMANYLLAPEWNRFKLGQTDLAENIVPNRWTLVKLHFDTSSSSGAFEAWLKPLGGDWFKVSEWIDGITEHFSWFIPDSHIGGHKMIRIPTTVDDYDTWIYLDDFVMASNEADLPVYVSTYPDPQPEQPTIPEILSLSPSGQFDNNVTQVELSISTNKEAFCAYSQVANTAFNNMQTMNHTGGLAHTTLVNVNPGNDYQYFVKCRDSHGNESEQGMLSFSIASQPVAIPPIISNGRPSWTVPYTALYTYITVETDINASCRYAQNSGKTFEQMTAFSRTNETFHSQNVAVRAGMQYDYFILCKSMASGGLSAEYHLHFEVEASLDNTPPVLSNLLHDGVLDQSTTHTQLQITTNELALCAYSKVTGQAFNNMIVMENDWSLMHAAAVNVVLGQSYQYFVKCQDIYGNESNERLITFSVDAPKPKISNGRPYWIVPYTATFVYVTVETDVNATCRFATTSGVSYNKMTSFSRTNETFHSVTRAVKPGTNYDYFVRCTNMQTNVLSDEYKIHFEVEAAL